MHPQRKDASGCAGRLSARHAAAVAPLGGVHLPRHCPATAPPHHRRQPEPPTSPKHTSDGMKPTAGPPRSHRHDRSRPIARRLLLREITAPGLGASGVDGVAAAMPPWRVRLDSATGANR